MRSNANVKYIDDFHGAGCYMVDGKVSYSPPLGSKETHKRPLKAPMRRRGWRTTSSNGKAAQ